MSPRIAELMAALPPEPDGSAADLPGSVPLIVAPAGPVPGHEELDRIVAEIARRPMPAGRLRRASALATLQGKVAAAYLAWWLRSAFAGAEQRGRNLEEAHVRAAVHMLRTMGYLRGAIMKVGQTLANYPEVIPDEYVEVLSRLHFEAPPMHEALVREVIRNELGEDPADVFAEFQERPFAAASLGQVHQARLKGSAVTVAVKVQYPSIGRAIRADARVMRAILAPMRLGADWGSLDRGLADIEQRLGDETDYLREADHLGTARSAFGEDDRIVVPRVYDELTTSRVLTMEWVPGVHLPRYLEGEPSQAERDAFGHLIVLASFRLSYGSHLLYADPHRGNYFFMPDGRLGVVDFGCCVRYRPADLEFLEEVERAFADRDERAMEEALVRAAELSPRQRRDAERMRLLREWSSWVWEPMWSPGPFDFGDEAYFRRGFDVYGEILRRRYVRGVPLMTWLGRNFLGIRAMLYQLGARVDMHGLWQAMTTVGGRATDRHGE